MNILDIVFMGSMKELQKKNNPPVTKSPVKTSILGAEVVVITHLILKKKSNIHLATFVEAK